MARRHVVLIGDSILDNGAYVGRGPALIDQLRATLPSNWAATLAAVDGAITHDVPAQLDRVPRDATHLVVSAGGNDALGAVNILEAPARDLADALELLARTAADFEASYQRLADAVESLAVPVTACTIYHPSFPDPRLQRLAATALALFNDVILRVAFARYWNVIDLRTVCSGPEHYANAIEPSCAGGERIAAAIVRSVTSLAPAGASLVHQGP